MCLLLLVVATLSAMAGWSATTSAVTWHNSGDTAFTATGGAHTLWLNSGALGCQSMQVTGTMSASPFVGLTWTAATLTTTASCVLLGTPYTMRCGYAFTATGQSTGAAPLTTTGQLDATCDWTLGSNTTPMCHVEGSRPVQYTNATATQTGRFTLPTASSQTGTPAGGCVVGGGVITTSHDAWRITTASGGPTAPHTGPVVTRTP